MNTVLTPVGAAAIIILLPLLHACVETSAFRAQQWGAADAEIKVPSVENIGLLTFSL